MSEANFAESLRRLLAHEGGYSNHPADPGGPTKYGITIGDYRKYIKPDATAADVKAMRVEDANQIYRERYWNVMRCGELPAGVGYAVFDYGVNSGVARAGKVLRRLLGLGSGTPAITAAVVEAANKASAQELVAAICDERLQFLKSLRTWPTFGAGWGRRVSEVRAAALTMARDSAATNSALRPRRGAIAAIVAALASVAATIAAWLQTPALWIVALIVAVIIGAGVWFIYRKRDRKTA